MFLPLNSHDRNAFLPQRFTSVIYPVVSSGRALCNFETFARVSLNVKQEVRRVEFKQRLMLVRANILLKKRL